jgi:hypothetical protein
VEPRDEALHDLWSRVILHGLNEESLKAQVEYALKNPEDALSASGLALQRVIGSGASVSDLLAVLRADRYETVFGTLEIIAEHELPPDVVDGLHEDLLLADPADD